jgi:hypothetical protein
MKFRLIAAVAASLMVAGCATAPAVENVAKISDPSAKEAAYAKLQADAPKPIEGSTGKFMSPFTSDGVTAEWVTKSMKVEASGKIGQAAGTLAAEHLLSNVPFAGMFAGDAAKKLARAAALKGIGGEEFLKSSSDLSFNTLDDMAAWMYAYHSSHEDYAKIVKATIGIYPDFARAYAKFPQP